MEEKKRAWREKFKIFAKYAIRALPKTAATLALFTPLTAGFRYAPPPPGGSAGSGSPGNSTSGNTTK